MAYDTLLANNKRTISAFRLLNIAERQSGDIHDLILPYKVISVNANNFAKINISDFSILLHNLFVSTRKGIYNRSERLRQNCPINIP